MIKIFLNRAIYCEIQSHKISTNQNIEKEVKEFTLKIIQKDYTGAPTKENNSVS